MSKEIEAKENLFRTKIAELNARLESALADNHHLTNIIQNKFINEIANNPQHQAYVKETSQVIDKLFEDLKIAKNEKDKLVKINKIQTKEISELKNLEKSFWEKQVNQSA